MKVEKTPLEGLLVITPQSFGDERGYFYEAYNAKRYKEHGLVFDFVQDNVSKSVYGTVRGLHYQVGDYAQGKLCSVTFGKVFDVALDIRSNSPTYGKYFGLELSEENKIQLFIPPGFAHGFSVLSDEAIFRYKCTNFYNKEFERAIKFDDPALGIDWKVQDPIVSEKDKQAKLFKEIDIDF